MTRFILLRHAEHDWLGRGLAGRMPGVGLNARGREHAQQLVSALAHYPVDAIVSSPQQRARETVAPLARQLGLPLELDDAFDEVDYGDWTGWSFERLQGEAAVAWQLWCTDKSAARAPGGEAFVEVPQRAAAGLRHWQTERPKETILVASHGDVIRAVIATVLGMPLDHLERLEVAPASLSIVDLEPGWMQVRLVNGHPLPSTVSK